ncbi:MAG: hypothetical protein V4555_14460, partial [Acidobacteriota bacterium]
MAKRRGNPNWGKPEPIGPVVPTVTSFEQVVKEYKLTPDQYVRSAMLMLMSDLANQYGRTVPVRLEAQIAIARTNLQ